MDSCLVGSYQLNSIKLSKPKKYSEYYVSKVKYSVDEEEDSDLVLQFPKMTLSEDPEEKNISVEFMNTRGYNKEVYNFLSGLDTYITEQVSKKSEEWFGKEIPLKSIKKMYNAFIKPPKTTEARCVINFGIKYHKEEVKTLFLDRKDNEISFSHFKKDEIVECIAQCKYIFFSKDTCFSTWELVSAKIHKKMQKVPDFGFVDDPDDRVVKVESDDEEDPDFSNAQFF
jgi:hypothetical protein